MDLTHPHDLTKSYAIVDEEFFKDFVKDSSKNLSDTYFFMALNGIKHCHSLEEPSLVIYGAKYYVVKGERMSREQWERQCLEVKFKDKLEGVLDDE